MIYTSYDPKEPNLVTSIGSLLNCHFKWFHNNIYTQWNYDRFEVLIIFNVPEGKEYPD